MCCGKRSTTTATTATTHCDVVEVARLAYDKHLMGLRCMWGRKGSLGGWLVVSGVVWEDCGLPSESFGSRGQAQSCGRAAPLYDRVCVSCAPQ